MSRRKQKKREIFFGKKAESAVEYGNRRSLHSSTEWGIKDPADRLEMSRPIGTNFITARGSLLSGLIMGLTKMCPWDGAVDNPVDAWFGENIVLPAEWTDVTIWKIYLRGKAYRLTAEHGAARAVLEELAE